MPANNITLEEAADFFVSGDSFLILCHKHPDGDTLGSALALKRALIYLEKKAEILCADLPSPNNEFLFDGEDFPAFDPEDENAVPVSVQISGITRLIRKNVRDAPSVQEIVRLVPLQVRLNHRM